mgnify:CR=1 FL=1
MREMHMPPYNTQSEGNPKPSPGELAALACLMEATAPKPGNVHRGADFEDATYFDFAVSALSIARAIDETAGEGLGRTLLVAVEATQSRVATNTNLGTLLLIVPLTLVPPGQKLPAGIGEVLGALTPADTHLVYEAILRAKPGGLGRVEQADVNESPPDDLIAAMRLAASRDLVARQYANGFADLLDFAVPALADNLEQDWSPADAIVRLHLQLMAEYPDSLVARKCGAELAEQSARMAAEVLAGGRPGEQAYERLVRDLDFWLRCDHHRRNPGTTADMVAASLFVALREELLTPPYRMYHAS